MKMKFFGATTPSRHFKYVDKILLGVIVGLCQLPAIAQSNYAQELPGVVRAEFLDVQQTGTRLVAVGERGHIVYSEDSGKTWTQARVPTTVTLTRLFFTDDKTGWAVGHEGNILVSNDGGVNWEVQRQGMTAQVKINKDNVELAKARVKELKTKLKKAAGKDKESDIEEQLDEADFELEDAKALVKEPASPPPLMDIWFADAERGFAVGAYGTLLYTANGGDEWQDWSRKVDNVDQLHLNGIDGSDDGKLWIASEWGNVFRSEDWGESWEQVETGYEGSFFGALYNPTHDSVYAYGLRGHIYRSTDGGSEWAEVESHASASLFGASVNADGRMVFVGSGGTVTSSSDNGETFESAMQANQRGLTGAVQLEDGSLVVSGAGGNQTLSLSGN